MMRFLSTSGTFARFVQPFTLSLDQQGLVFVEGRNHDCPGAFSSNGAGKSLLFEALKWCYYGKMSRYGNERLSADEVCYDGHGADVTNVFSNSTGTFSVRRYVSPNGSPRVEIMSQNSDDESWDPLQGAGAIARDANDTIVNLLGFDYQTLRYALTLEGTSLDIVNEGFAAQMKILESILRFDVFTEAAKTAKQRYDDYEKQARQHVDEIDRQTLIKSTAENTLAEYEQLDESAREDEITSCIDVLTPNVSMIESYEKRVQRYMDKSGALTTSRDSLRRDRTDIEKRLGQTRKLLTTDGDKVTCPTCEQEVQEATAEVLIEHLEVLLTQKQEALAVVTTKCEVAQLAEVTAHTALLSMKHERQELEQLERELKDLRVRKSKRLAMINTQTTRITTAETEIARITDEVTDVKRLVNTAQFWAKRGFDGLKQETLGAAGPVLNHAAQRYGEIMSDGAIQVVFDTRRETRTGGSVIRASGDTGPTYQSMSNGEKRRTQIIVALSLRALARWRIAEPINMACFDEIFDGLDDSGVSRLLQVLQQDMDEMSSVFVITHSDAVRALFPGAKRIVVDRHHGESRIISRVAA